MPAQGGRGLERLLVEEEERLRPEACQSPIWDTALAVLALRACGVLPRRRSARQGRRMAARRGGHGRRRLGCPPPGSGPGGWAFEFENDLYPDVDDAAVVCLALRELELGEDAVQRGLAWIAGMQSENGGWERSTPTTRARGSTSSRSVTSAPSSTRPRRMMHTRSRRSPTTMPMRMSSAGASTTCSAASSATARGGAGGASTMSTERGRRCRRSRRAASARAIPPWSAPPHGSTRCSTQTAVSEISAARITTPRGGDAASRRLHKPPTYVAAGKAKATPARRAAGYLCATAALERRLGRAALHRDGFQPTS